jgi:hypothetical protein
MSKPIGYLVAVCLSVFTIGLAEEARAGAVTTASYIDFNVAANTVGSITYAGGSTPIIGSGIPVNLVSGGPLNSASPVACTSCTLSFQTGNFDSMTNSFMGGGAINIVGLVPAAGISTNSMLLSGTFMTATLIPAGPATILSASLNDTKHPDLLAFFGIPAGTTFTTQGLNISFSSVPGMVPGSFTSTAIGNSNVVNAADTPSSLLLLGTGLGGLAFLRVRNRAGGSLPNDKGPALGEGAGPDRFLA